MPKCQRGLPTEIQKVLDSVFPCVRPSRNSDRKIHPIHLKFGTNVFVLSEISWIVLVMDSAYTQNTLLSMNRISFKDILMLDVLQKTQT